MSCLGVHFALTEAEVKKIKSMAEEQDRLEYLTEEIEEQSVLKGSGQANRQELSGILLKSPLK